jgi:hypothetical protein
MLHFPELSGGTVAVNTRIRIHQYATAPWEPGAFARGIARSLYRC